MSISDTDTLARLGAKVADELVALGAASGDDHKRLAMTREVVRRIVDDHVEEMAREGQVPPSPEEESRAIDELVSAIYGLGGIERYMVDDEVENLIINGCDEVWITYCDGTKAKGEAVADSDEALIELVQRSARTAKTGERRWDGAVCELHLQLPDGSRLFGLREVCPRPSVTIRKHRFMDIDLETLVSLGSITGELAEFFEAAVLARKNILVAGPMNAGKTTILRALCSQIPAHERLVTVEEDYELGLDKSGRYPDLVPLQARPPNTEGAGGYDMAKLVRNSLRMTADRVIVGEVRGAEVIPMLNAMSQGRAGSMCTIHADSSEVVFARLASYAMQAPERLSMEAANVLIASAIHFVVYVHLEDNRVSKASSKASSGESHGEGTLRRYVSSVRELSPSPGELTIASNEIFRSGPGGMATPHALLRESTRHELSRFGYHHPAGEWAAARS